MNRFSQVFVLTTFIASAGTALAGNHDPAAIIRLLGDAKLTLVEGVALAEKTYGPAISAKYEVGDDGKLGVE